MLFPSQFFIYNHSKVLVSQSSFNTITVYIYCEGLCAHIFVCDQHIFCFGDKIVRVCLQLTNPLLLSFHDSPSFVIFPDCCRFELKLHHQQKV